MLPIAVMTPFGAFRHAQGPGGGFLVYCGPQACAVVGCSHHYDGTLFAVGDTEAPYRALQRVASVHSEHARRKAAEAVAADLLPEFAAYLDARAEVVSFAVPDVEAPGGRQKLQAALAHALGFDDPFRAAVAFEAAVFGLRADVTLVYLLRDHRPDLEAEAVRRGLGGAAASAMEAETAARSPELARAIRRFHAAQRLRLT